jgi:hypothetical protein
MLLCLAISILISNCLIIPALPTPFSISIKVILTQSQPWNSIQEKPRAIKSILSVLEDSKNRLLYGIMILIEITTKIFLMKI